MAEYPADVRYTKEHEWARAEDDLVRVGITSFAVGQLGDVTVVDLPGVGDMVSAHEPFGEIESVKTASELFAPITGEIVEVNDGLDASPELVNDSPYSDGWLIVVRPTDPSEVDTLMDNGAYETFIAEQD